MRWISRSTRSRKYRVPMGHDATAAGHAKCTREVHRRAAPLVSGRPRLLLQTGAFCKTVAAIEVRTRQALHSQALPAAFVV